MLGVADKRTLQSSIARRGSIQRIQKRKKKILWRQTDRLVRLHPLTEPAQAPWLSHKLRHTHMRIRRRLCQQVAHFLVTANVQMSIFSQAAGGCVTWSPGLS